MRKSRILIVDDNTNTRTLFSEILAEEGYLTVCTKDGEEALDALTLKEADLVLLDLKLPGIDGIQVLERIRETNQNMPVIMISGEGDIESAVKVLKLGAYDFLEKPIVTERLIVSVRNALLNAGLQGKLERLEEEMGYRYRMVGNSPAMSRLRELIVQASSNNAHVLITGETGSGKELVARAIHSRSNRSLESFVKLNCAAIPSELFESELFGYSKGAFTGAVKDKKGRIEAADGGTIFFDEIGELSIQAQAKLLQFLDSQTIERLGETISREIDVRVIAATNRELVAEVHKKRFREDLYYRLNVIDIQVPALREHREDIRALAEYFVECFCAKLGLPKKTLKKDAIKKLTDYPWYGNIRQLRNIIEKTVSMSNKPVIYAEDLPLLSENDNDLSLNEDIALYKARQDFERRLIMKVLEYEKWNVSTTAKRLGIDRTNLYRKIRTMKIKKP